MKEEIIFKTLSGSKLYGTDSINSDTDIKGVFLPEVDDLLLCKAPKHYTFTTNNSNKKNDSSDVDETYYSLQYYLELLAKGDTTALDMLFAYTNEKAILQTSPIWNNIINNIDAFITKNMKAYLGYCKSQCIKYSLKGDKLNNFYKFLNFLSRENSYTWAEEGDITLYHCLNFALKGNYNNKVLDKYIPKIGEEKIKFTKIDFGEHCYIETANNKESYLVISGIKFQLNDWCKSNMDKVERVIDNYGKRAKNAAEDNGVDYKAISHAVRVILQVEEILKTGKLQFPLKEAKFIKSIKYKTTEMSFEEIISWIETKIKEIENVLLPNSNLQEKVNQHWINQFILICYDFVEDTRKNQEIVWK